MPVKSPQKIAIIGAGVSGVAAAGVWKKCGYNVTVFEASESIGGQWIQAYPGATLQNTAPQYQFGDFPWPFTPDRHPTRDQIVRYIQAASEHFELDDIRLKQRVTKMEETESGWELYVNNGTNAELFSYVLLATGQYSWSERRILPAFKNIEAFKGQVVTNVASEDVFQGKKVVVLGFGKTALDFCCWSATRAKETHHIFRHPRWTIPDHLLGVDYTLPFFSRFGSDMMPAWVHSSGPQSFLHKHMGGVVSFFWLFIATLFRYQHEMDAKLGNKPKSVLDPVLPPKSNLRQELRSAIALATPGYYEHVAHERIHAKRAVIESFTETGVILSTGEEIKDVDLVCTCFGNDPPTFSFLPNKYRGLVETSQGGPLLYRHLIHPEIPRLGFAGFNHGFMHIASCELGALWQVAAFRGELELLSVKEMTASAERVSQWKRDNTTYEPQYNMCTNTRFQQHNDALLQDLGISQWRKLPNVAAEIFCRYDPTDYAGIVAEYTKQSSLRKEKGVVQKVTSLDV